MPHRDSLSLAVISALAPEQIELLRDDTELRAEAELLSVDLDRVLTNLALDGGERLRALADKNPELHLATIFELLVRRRVRFVVIGGLAGAVYGSTYATGDFDICHAREIANLRRLAGILRGLSAEFRRAPQFAPPVLHESTFVTEMDFVFTTTLGKFDLIGQMTGVGAFAEASSDCVDVRFHGRAIPVMSLPKLISSKRSTLREKDARVADELTIVSQAIQRLSLVERQ
jgi:hypothetical protein